MTKEEAISFGNMWLEINEDAEDSASYQFFKMAISALDEKPLSENKGEWIPVSERLPKIADVYRVTRYYPNNVMNPNYIVDACAFDGSDTWYDDNRINHERAYVNNVIAWQENPEPYKADTKGKSCNTCKNSDDEFSGECYECIKGIFDHYEPEEEKAESEEDFPQAKDIEPTVENFSKVFDNKLISNAMEEDRCCVCGGVKRFGICQDCGSDM